jgi:small-conductance mechanosensitive channel
MSSTPLIDLESWLQALLRPSALLELGVLVLCALMAWLLVRAFARALHQREPNTVLFGRHLYDGVLFPLMWLALAFVAEQVMARVHALAVMKLAVPALLALVVIRVGAKILQVAFKGKPVIRVWERSISWLAWLVFVLWVSGLLPLVLEQLDQVGWTVGGAHLTLRKIIEGTVTAGLVLLLTLWLSSAIESRLLRAAKRGDLSWRMAVSNALRALLMFLGLLMALSAVGIDLTALSVLGGAVGVGIGFGLQKLAANYVSGFIILAERNMRIGDTVQVDNFSGVITQINARSTVIRSLGGREAIVPNEQLITTRVENLSLADTKVWLSTKVQVGYDSDVQQVMDLLKQAALIPERVLQEPGPGINLSSFAADGLEFTVGFWIADPENGTGNVISLVNLEILRLLREHQIEIPYPQRVVHQASA